MGILLTVMFLANAGAALVMLPAFAAFLMKDRSGTVRSAAAINASGVKP